MPHLPHVPHRFDHDAPRTVIARREVMSGRGKDLRLHWMELRHVGGRFRIATGAHWQGQRGSERMVHSTTSLRDAVSHANRRARALHARHGDGRAAPEDLRLIEVQRICIAQGLLLDPDEDLPELGVIELSDALFS